MWSGHIFGEILFKKKHIQYILTAYFPLNILNLKHLLFLLSCEDFIFELAVEKN